ncbi:MAG TPA: helix-hairpin-helix domain-containing protein [Candidatus Thermoplasmatota archaeon]|jgi:DNA polymerase (family 10)|nr:helix-hairpin-helix domain-containing protein [Candidatus Thermoplasmatota archaeon]
MVRCADAAALLDELADLEQLQGDTFRANAYRRAARTLFQVEGELEAALASGAVEALPGIGEGILKKLREYAATGKMRKLEEMRDALPAGLLELIKVPGLGPKRALQLHKELKIDSVAQLKEAAEKGRLLGLKGFGPKSQADILKGIAALASIGRRVMLPEAHHAAEDVLAALEPHAAKIAMAGSLRRRRDTVGDLDFVAVPKARSGEALRKALLGLAGAEALAAGERKTSVRLISGLQVDLRVMAPEEFGAAMMYFTGSKAHNIKLRGLALRKGWRLNEYGLFEVEQPPKPRGKQAAKGEEEREPKLGQRIAGATEEDVYAKLGLPYIAPEIREDLGEVEAALDGKLPKLVEERDLRGDLHTHSNRSDGILSPEDWIKAAARSQLEYIGLTDHSIGLPGWGLTGEQLLEHKARVEELADKHAGRVKVFVGTEANILKDGDLDLPANVLDQLDVVVAGVHTSFQMGPEEMTERICRALRSGRIDILSHPTGRKIGQREPLRFDVDQVFEAAAESGTCLELDCQHDRLDLNGELARRAREWGCRFAVDSDAHGAPGKHLLGWGLDQARRGWLEPAQVVTTRKAGEVLKELKRR